MPRNSQRSGKSKSRNGSRKDDWGGVVEMARERPVAAAAAAAGAAAAGVFLWSKRNQISRQIGHLGDRIGDMMSSRTAEGDDTAGLTESATKKSGRGRTSTAGLRTGMSKTGNGNASGRARSQPAT